MALNLKSKAAAAKATQQSTDEAPKSGLSFLKRGKEAREAFAKEEHKAEMRAKTNVFRFFVPKDKETRITFLDGDITSDMLDIPFYYEHNVNMNGNWGNFFICLQDTNEPCPICEGGLNPSYVGLLTVIDHSQYKSEKDGKIYKDQIRLFAAKRETVKTLQNLAKKRGGLRGCRFDVSRTGDKSAAVGNVFDFQEKLTMEQIQAKYGEKAVPINYDEVLEAMFMSAKDLRKLGFGSSTPPIGSEKDDADYSNQL